MEVALAAPIDAVVGKIHCKAGDYIAAGQLLLVMLQRV